MSKHVWSTTQFDEATKDSGVHFWYQLPKEELGILMQAFGRLQYEHNEIFKLVVQNVIKHGDGPKKDYAYSLRDMARILEGTQAVGCHAVNNCFWNAEADVEKVKAIVVQRILD